MTVIHKDRTARVEHSCGWDCGHPIRLGDRYVMSSLTPNDSEIGNIGWWHHALHGRSRYDCPDYASTRGEGGQAQASVIAAEALEGRR